ncbi:MAG: LPS export ABC transporter permease LptF [Alphaproteobacteria bacterium]|nr:LPS export ABC transporter permease LptF [Alphaproteobacteria bacterium]
MLITRIDRYMFRQLLVALIASTGGLVALIWLTQSLRFIEMMINRGLSLLVFMRLTSLLIPSFVAVILPITTFVVVQFIYQRLSTDRELTVMRAAGLSPWALARPALAVGIVSVLVGYLLNIWVVPAASAAFREYQFEIRNRMAAFLLQEGVFTTVSDDLTIYVRTRDPDGTLHGVLIDDARQKNSHATVLAERGRLIPSPTAPRVILENGSRQEIDKQTGRLNMLTFAQNALDLSENSKAEAQRYRDPTEMSVRELLHPNPAVWNPREFGKLRAEAHKRLTAPLTALSFALVALVSVLTGTFRRHGGLLRIVAAVASVVALLAAQLALFNLAARAPALLPLVWVEAIAPGLIAAWALFGPRPERRRRVRPLVLREVAVAR